jgi:carboxypeptidase family protein
MTAALRTFALCALILVCFFFDSHLGLFAQQAPTPESAASQDKQLPSVAGQILGAGTNDPLRKARVILRNQVEQGADPYVAFTDIEGRFSITGIQPGRYEMNIERDGYVSKSYGEDESGNSSSILALDSGQRVTDLIFHLQKRGAITGRVTDEDGDPAEGVTVEALVRRRFRGKDSTTEFRSAKTNDLGEYRIFDLPAGRYLVRATFESRSASIIGKIRLGNSTVESAGGYLPTYYSNVSEISRASAVDLRPGDEVPGVDFTLLRGQSYRVRGQIFNAAVEHPRVAGGTLVTLVPKSLESPALVDLREGEVNSITGEFEVDDVPPGSYTLFAVYQDEQGRFLGSARVDIVNTEVDSIRVVIARGAEVRGRVVSEGKMAASSEYRVTFEPRDSQSLGEGESVETKNDGTFSVAGLADGVYDIDAGSFLCGTCFLKSATVNGLDILDAGLLVSSGSAPSPLELVYSDATGAVDGTVVREDGLPAVGATVMLFPDHLRRASQPDYRTGSTDQNGRFVVKGVAPGNYHAFAWQNFDYEMYTDPEFLKSIEQKAQAFSISTRRRRSSSRCYRPLPRTTRLNPFFKVSVFSGKSDNRTSTGLVPTCTVSAFIGSCRIQVMSTMSVLMVSWLCRDYERRTMHEPEG